MLLGTGLDPLLPSEQPHRLNILPYGGVMTSITVTKGPTFKSDLSPAIQQIMAESSPLTTHVLNATDGVPAARMALSLHRLDSKLMIWAMLSVG